MKEPLIQFKKIILPFVSALFFVIGIFLAVFAIWPTSLRTLHAQTSDAPLLPVPPVKNDCNVVSPGAIFTGTQDFNPNAPDWTGWAYPYNLIYKEWMRIGGPDSPIGCPIGQAHTDSDGIYVQFQHGQIAVSPNVWEQGVVAAYQDYLTGEGIIVDWTVSWDDPSQYNYTKFLVRWDYSSQGTAYQGTNYQHFDDVDPKPCERGDGDQCDVLADMTEVQVFLLHYFHDTHLRTKGTFRLPDNGFKDSNGNRVGADHGYGHYRIEIRGCDEGAIGESTCRQDWMHSVEVNFQPRTDHRADFPIDLTIVPSADDAASSKATFFQRAAAITLHNACLPLLPYSAYRHEEDYTSIILAKLDYANYYQEDHCPGRNLGGPGNRQEAFASLRNQSIDSKVGTTIDSCPGCRTGEYDVALSGYMPVINRFGTILPGDVYNHIVNDLLDERGPLDLSDHSIYAIGVPESENHINMIESSRYLTNDLLYAQTGEPQYDNSSNATVGPPPAFSPVPSMRDYWLNRLHNFLQTDFIEYNARPYQGYSMRAIQNLYSYAMDPQVKAAAGMVLDYVSAKVAASSSNSRRALPYRRKAEYNDPWLIGFHADAQSARMMALAGDLSILEQTSQNVDPNCNTCQKGFFAPWYGRPDMEMAIVSSYRVPDIILDSMINPKHRIFYQGIHHYADEQYAASPSFLISAGGHHATYAYTFAGKGSSDDLGMALPTTVMPTGFFISRDDLIRFNGSSDDTTRSNMGVAPNFACGINPPVLPDAFNKDLGLYDSNGVPCVDQSTPWTFINFTSACRLNTPRLNDDTHSPNGFYAALYQRTDPAPGIESIIQPGSIKTGFVEVFDTQVNPNVSFGEFVQHVLAANDKREYHAFAKSNTYVTITGQEIGFELAPDSRILDIKNGPAPVQSTSDFATGTIIQSSGTSGLVTITNPYTGEKLTLDDSNPSNPVRSTSTIPAYARDTCLVGFVWRMADPTDHVCVTTAQYDSTQLENKVAQAHTVPGTVDTCKQGYRWRLADATDHVCVLPSSYIQAQWDNKLRLSRLAAPLP